ncbi:MAG: DUF4190 domain-containing protein [Phycisphaerales bacterium]|nr:DUF4190 domain-containing protein [Phycisphaerales bacterium]
MSESNVDRFDPRQYELDPRGGLWPGGDPSFAPPSAPRWSIVAITGFVLSFLLALAPLGVLLGIVGIFRTRGGRRKGMGLAIAAIPVGVVVSALVGMLALYGVVLFDMQREALHVGAVLRASRTTVMEKADAFYKQFPRFESFAPRDVFTEWLTGVITKNGSMTAWKPSQTPLQPQLDGSWELHYTGDFVNGSADVAVTFFAADWRQMDLRDLAVDGVSVVPKLRAVDVDSLDSAKTPPSADDGG